jgi:hypothetical protein
MDELKRADFSVVGKNRDMFVCTRIEKFQARNLFMLGDEGRITSEGPESS